MEPSTFASMDKDLQLLPKDEKTGESSHSRTHEDQMLPELNDSLVESDDLLDLDRRRNAGMYLCDPFSREAIKMEHGKLPWKHETKEFKLACALATVTLQEFENISWNFMENMYYLCSRECRDDMVSFKCEVFDALARFIWNLYDEEDFENIAYTGDIFNECESIFHSVYSKRDSELESSLTDVSKYEKVREQDVCNILKWCSENKSLNKDKLDISRFEPEVLLHRKSGFYHSSNFMRYVRRSRFVMFSSDNLDPKGMVKQQLRMELSRRKCFCVVDALYMQSWKQMNFQKLEAVEPCKDLLKELVADVHQIFYKLVVTRMEQLHKCQSLVTYPVSGNMFGSWDPEVQEVIKCADLRRRSEGRRFIGTDHLVLCLHQVLVSESVYMNSKVLRSNDDDEKHEDTVVYHLYRKSNKIAAKLGHETIGLEHLYVAITSANDNESSWKDSVERVRRMAIAKRKFKEKGGRHPNFLDIILGKSFWKREIKSTLFYFSKKVEDKDNLPWETVSDFVKKINDENNAPLQTAISDVLSFKVDENTQMNEEEMINSLKKDIEINHFHYHARKFSKYMFLSICSYNILWLVTGQSLVIPACLLPIISAVVPGKPYVFNGQSPSFPTGVSRKPFMTR